MSGVLGKCDLHCPRRVDQGGRSSIIADVPHTHRVPQGRGRVCVWLIYEFTFFRHMAKQKTPALRLLGDRVLVKSFDKDAEAKTAAGIILPGKEGESKYERGEVLSVGSGKLTQDGKRIALDIKNGDIVLFKRDYMADEITVEGEEYVILSESSILAVETK